MDFLVGTFYTPKLFTLRFTAPDTLQITHTSSACGGHSWLSISANRNLLYTTVWADTPAIAAYALNANHTVTFLNSKPVRAMSGYVCNSATHIYSAGGPTGEVFSVNSDGSVGEEIQRLEFRDAEGEGDGKRDGVAHGSFGGLRHGAHSVDLSPDGKTLYIADIGHNCVWSFGVQGDGRLREGMKWIASRAHDGPRHCWPHPDGKILYSLQEHSSMVDILSVGADGTTLDLIKGVRIIPEDRDEKEYWADEVRVSRPIKGSPRYLYASTRGLEKETMGYVAVFALDEQGLIQGDTPIDIFETLTSGGIANAIELAPATEEEPDVEYMAMTDSQEGYVFILAFDGKKITEAARLQLKSDDGKNLAAATAVWL